MTDAGALLKLIDVRLADLREANAAYEKASWDRSDRIQRNDREIRWLIDFRTLLATSQGSAGGGRLTFCETCNANTLHRRTSVADGVMGFECERCALSPPVKKI